MKRFRTVLNIIFAVVGILMLITVIGLNENSTYLKNDYDEDFCDGWMLSLSDGTTREMTFPYDYSDGSSSIRISRTLPNVTDDTVVQIMCNYQSMSAYVDGEEIFHALPSTFGLVKTDMGHYIALIPLSAEHSLSLSSRGSLVPLHFLP